MGHSTYSTLCGDMRWQENFTSILREKGYNIIWTADNESLEKSKGVKIEVEFEVDGVKDKKNIGRYP